jgi:hypothetical protein
MCDAIHTTENDPPTCVQTYQIRTRTFIPVHNAIVHTIHKRAHARGYLLHSLEYLECRVVGKCCSNVLRSLCAYGVVVKAVRTCVCENDIAHVRRSRCAIPYTQSSARSYTSMHTCMPTYQIQTRVHTYLHSSTQRNSTYHTQTCPTIAHSREQAMCCTHLSVWSVELWTSTAAMCCAPSARMELL